MDGFANIFDIFGDVKTNFSSKITTNIATDTSWYPTWRLAPPTATACWKNIAEDVTIYVATDIPVIVSKTFSNTTTGSTSTSPAF